MCETVFLNSRYFFTIYGALLCISSGNQIKDLGRRLAVCRCRGCNKNYSYQSIWKCSSAARIAAAFSGGHWGMWWVSFLDGL